MAYTKTNWLDHVVDGSGQVIQQGTPLSAANLNRMEQGIADAHAQFEDSARQTVTLRHGMNVIQADQASPLNATVYGRTLVNLLGRDGGCESLEAFRGVGAGSDEISTTIKHGGASSIKITMSENSRRRYKDYSYPLDESKNYILAGWVYIESYESGTVPIALESIGTNNSEYSAFADTSIIGKWQFVYIKIPISNKIIGPGFRLRIGSNPASTYVAYFDDIRLYVVPSEDYIAIGTKFTANTTPSIDDQFPYVDGIQHLQGATIRKVGKNLLPPFSEWTLNANATVTESYGLVLNATNTFQISMVRIPVVPGQKYTFSTGKSTGYYYLKWINSSGVQTSWNNGEAIPTGTSSTAPVDAISVQVEAGNMYGTGAFYFRDPMFILGDASALPFSFEPRNEDYVYIPTKLASSIDGDLRDSVDIRTGQVTKRFITDIPLTGEFLWGYPTSADYVGFKRVRVSNWSSVFPAFDFTGGGTGTSIGKITLLKNDGSVLINADSAAGWTSGDRYTGGSTYNNLDVSVSDSDSGWGEDYTPLSAEIKAYFLGWRMNNGTFGTPYNNSGTKTWVPLNATSNTGAVTTVPTTPSSAITGGAYDYYRLSYLIAKTVTESVKGFEGAIGLHGGGNAVELLEGVIVRERANVIEGSTYFNINNTTFPGSLLKSRTNSIIAVYRNGMLDKEWQKLSVPDAYGKQRAQILKSDFDPTAEYTVTYIALDRHKMTTNAVEATASYNTNQKTVVDSLVQKVTDVETTTGVNVNAIAELYKRVKALGG